MIDPHVEPLHFRRDAQGNIVVDVLQQVRDRSGTLLDERRVQHVYHFEHGLVRSMEIRGL